MRARVLSFWLALSHTFNRCFSKLNLKSIVTPRSFSDSEFLMISSFMFALEDVDVLRSK